MEILEPSISTLSPNDTSLLTQPIMHLLTTALLWGSVALQSVLGWPGVKTQRSLLKRDVDSFVASETPIALEQLLCNIGPDGCHSSGVDPGLVIASPSTVDPDCQYNSCADGGPELISGRLLHVDAG